MKILIAAEESGALKEVVCQKGTDTSSKDAVQPESVINYCQETKKTRIQQIINASIDSKNYIITTRAGGSVLVVDPESYETLHKYHALSRDLQDDFISLFQSSQDKRIYACTRSGRVSIIDLTDFKAPVSSVQLLAPVDAFVENPEQANVFAYGGEENDVKVVRFIHPKEEQDVTVETIFQAKNVKNTRLDLRQPIWVSKIHFVSHNDSGMIFVVITKYGQVRKYDTSKGRRPVIDHRLDPSKKTPLIGLAGGASISECVVSDKSNNILKVDFEIPKILGKFHGPTGATRAISLFDGRYLVTGSLDRYLRVYDINSREQIVKVYVGCTISAALCVADDEEEEVESSTNSEEENDEIWDKLEESDTKRRKI